MALCHKQCPDCPMTTTVLIEGRDCVHPNGNHVVQMHEDSLAEIYEQIVADEGTNVADLAVILRIDGVDVASKCSHETADDIELF